MEFFKTLLLILLIYFGLRFVWRISKPYVFRYLQRKAERHFSQAFGGASFGEEPSTREGEVSIDKMPSAKKQPKTQVGQYVDYEEID